MFNVALMPFEGTHVDYAAHGMCYPGLGLRRYMKMGSVLLMILDQVLPKNFHVVMEMLKRAHNAKENGYDLMWHLTKKLCPHFDKTKAAPWPVWDDGPEIYSFAKAVQMHCDLARHRGSSYTRKQQSEMFLRNITGEQYRGHAGSLLLTLTGEKEDIPLHYRIPALVDRLVAVADDDVLDDLNLAPAYATNSLVQPPTQPQGTVRFPQVEQPAAPPIESPTVHIQGYVNRLTGDRGGPRGQSRPRDTATDRRPRHRPDAERSDRRHQANPQRYQGRCDACGRWGHLAVKCDMVGMGLFLKRYMADRKNTDAIKDAESNWMTRNAKFLPSKNKDHTPRRVLTRYCEAAICGEDQVDLELDWGFFCPEVLPPEA